MTLAGRELLARCEAVGEVARRAWGRRLFGRRTDRGPVLAAVESTGQADYATGDDFRNVDWQRAARLDELVSRQHRGVETGAVEIVLDTSRRMGIGTPPKFALARQLAVVLGCFAFSAGRQVRIGGAGTQRDAQRMLDSVQALEPDADAELLGKQITLVAQRLRRGDLAVVLSDLLQPSGLEKLIAPFARPAEQLLIVQVLAPEDLEPAWLEGVELSDVGGEDTLRLDLTEADLARYREAAAEFCRQTRRRCQARGIPIVQVRSDVGFDRAVEHVIHVLADRSGMWD